MTRAACSASLCAVVYALVCFPLLSQPSYGQHPEQAETLQAKLPVLFEQNAGQFDPRVRYLARAGRYDLFLTDTSAVLKIAGQGQAVALRTTLEGASEQASAAGVEEQLAKTNYLLGPPRAWKTGVANFGAVEYQGIYRGIDLKYYSHQRQLEYDFNVAAHADPSQICLRVEGTEQITIDKNGSLVLKTAVGDVRWLRPQAYQETDHGRRVVTADYRLDKNVIRFTLGSYDHSRALVIDPAIVYGTFLDGSGFERYIGFHVDSAGYAFIVGETGSSDFPVTPGAYQHYTTQNYTGEVFVSKLSQDGSTLVWSTIVGGTGTDNASLPNAFTLDSSDNVYIAGQTADFTVDDNGNTTFYTSTFPTSTGAYNTHELASWRNFLVKLNSSGSALDFSTFLSDEPNITPTSVAVDVASAVYVTGFYNHAGGLTAPFPATKGVYQSTYAGDDDAFIMKFNQEATALDYATLIGGPDDDYPYQISVNSAGQATINGYTYSTNYPITPNGLRQTDEGGFISTFNWGGTALIYSTVLNHVLEINVKRDTAGYYYAGGSAGTNLPTTSNAFQTTFPATLTGIHLGFLTEINPSGDLVYSSYIGGNPSVEDQIEDTQIQLVSSSQVTVAGNRSQDPLFPVTDRTYEQDSCSFIAKFNTQASGSSSLLYSGCTPINETNNMTVEQFRGIPLFTNSDLYIDKKNDLYGLNSFGPTTPNAFQPKPPNQTSGDGYYTWFGKYNLLKLDTGGVNLSSPLPEPEPFNTPVVFRATGRSPQCSAGVASMRVYTQPGVIAYTTLEATLDANIAFPAPEQNVYSYNPVIVVYDNCGKAFTLTIPLLIQGPAGTPPDPNVVSPTQSGVVISPVHFVASATAVNCNNGISAMGIYTAPGVLAFKVNGSSLDTYLAMSAGTYNTVVQAWDNCGNAYKAPVTITVE